MSVFSIAVVGFFTLLSLQSSNAVAQAPKVSESSLRAHLAFLADDLLEGRLGISANRYARLRALLAAPLQFRFQLFQRDRAALEMQERRLLVDFHHEEHRIFARASAGLPACAAKKSRGCGSNVSTALGRPRCWASLRSRASMAWCPRCTPSKLPMVRAQAGATPGWWKPRKTFMNLLSF